MCMFNNQQGKHTRAHWLFNSNNNNNNNNGRQTYYIEMKESNIKQWLINNN